MSITRRTFLQRSLIAAAGAVMLDQFAEQLAGAAPAPDPATGAKPPEAKPPAWRVLRIAPAQPAAVFEDGEAVKIDVIFDQPVVGSYRIERVRRHGGFDTEEASQVVTMDIGRLASWRLPALTMDKDRHYVWSLAAKPLLHGVYAVRVTGADAVEGLATTFALVPKHHPGFRSSPIIMTNWGGTPRDVYDEMAAMTQRAGFKWVREETGWRQDPPGKDGRPGAYQWDVDDMYANAMRKYQIYGLIGDGHAPEWAWPKGPDGKPIYYSPGKPSTVPSDANLDGFEEWHYEYVKRYGDVVKMLDLFNEPWEGGGISGFGSTGAHLREMMKRAFRGAKRADSSFMVGGCDSHSENEDHLLCDPNAVNYTDFLAYHTYIRSSTTGSLQAAAYGKQAYDTESWVGCGVTTPFGIVNALAMGMRSTHNYWQDALVISRAKGLVMPNAPLSQAAAANWMLTDMDYVGQPNARCLPCLFVFKQHLGAETQRIFKSMAYFSAKPFPWVGNNDFVPENLTKQDLYNSLNVRGEMWDQIIPDGTLNIADPKNELMVYDFDANPMPALKNRGAWVIPIAINGDCYIICKNGPDRLMALLNAAKIQGMPPAQIEFRDFTRRLETNPPLQVVIHNAYNVPLTGRATVTSIPQGWAMDTTRDFTAIPPGGSELLEFTVTRAPYDGQNLYPFAVRVDTDKGTCDWQEDLRCNVIAKGTITIDGKLDDWAAIKAVPQTFFGKEVPPDPVLRYMMPYEKFATISGEGYFGQFAAAYDDDNFYCMMTLNDPTPKVGTSMVKGKWYEMVPGTNNTVYKMEPLSPATMPDQLQIAFDFQPNVDDYLSPTDPMYRQFPFKQTDYEYSLYPTRENGAELWRCNYTPFSPNPYSVQGVVEKYQAVAQHDGKQWIFEMAIPWTEMPLLKRAVTSGKTINFAYKVRRGGGDYYSTQMRSACKRNGPSWHPDYMWENWSVETGWGFE